MMMAAALIGSRNHPESLILESLVETATAAVAIKTDIYVATLLAMLAIHAREANT